MSAELSITFGGYSSAGVKDENQDAFALWQPTSGAVRYKGLGFCVADGVSCSEHAQQASGTSVTHFLNDYYSTPDSWDVKTAASRVLSALNSWLYHHGQQASARHNSLVTTFSGMILKASTLHLFHVGDSRISRLRSGSLETLTRDHTHRAGNRDLLSRALGMDVRVEVDYRSEDIAVGDVFLLSSDGLHGFLDPKVLTETLRALASDGRTQHDFEKAARTLVEQALANGSDDNLTALLVRVDQVPTADLNETHRELTRRVIPPVLTVGQKIDHYEVEQVLFSGTRSHLYKVLNLRNNRHYALKAPSQNFEEDLVYLEGFIREQWIGSRIDHAHVMRIEPPLAGGHFLYHVCELIEGQSLRQWMDDHPGPEISEVREWTGQIISALRALQRMGMVHRDIKPENVMITRKGQVKLIDFGTVQVKGLAELPSVLDEDIPVGSVNYIAPEYVIDHLADSRSDLFGLAVVVYEMLCGEQPYKMEKVYRRGAKSWSEWRYHPLKERRKDIPLWLDLAIEKGCHPDVNQRHQAYSEFWKDLNEPNTTLLSAYEHRPLLSRAGLAFWKSAALVLGIVAVIEGLYILRLNL
ncbi:MAG: serine/threonine protein kinase [Oceanospirillaceae bacterium]|nr:serine/threonine protein kinase [Oceanospirillaceae bacterium]|tara:strand:- start:3032 stop:4780 length:1749 start_codon:yes stop_codon:yes gene_type:complete